MIKYKETLAALENTYSLQQGDGRVFHPERCITFVLNYNKELLEALHIAQKYEEEKKGLDGWVSYLQGRIKELEKKINM